MGGSSCSTSADDAPEGAHIIIDPGAVLLYGIDYAFVFEIYNAATIDAGSNFWRFETEMNEVLFHLDSKVLGFQLAELNTVTINQPDTTSANSGYIYVYIRSTKRIPSMANIRVIAPAGYQPRNRFDPIPMSGDGEITLAS